MGQPIFDRMREMIAMEDIFSELQDAISSGDKSRIEMLRRKMLSGGRNIAIDVQFLEAIKGKTLYKNMLRAMSDESELSVLDYAKLVSSLITHCFIECQQTNLEFDDYPIRELYIILGEFVNGSESIAISKVKSFLEERYAWLIERLTQDEPETN